MITKKQRQEWGRKGGQKAWKGKTKEERTKAMNSIRYSLAWATDEQLLMELRRRKLTD